MATEAEYLGPREVQQALGISQATYYRWLREGRLKGVKVGRRWRFPPEEVDRLLGRGVASDVDRACEVYRGRLDSLIDSKEAGDMTATTDVEGLARMVIEHALRRNASDVHIAPVAEGLGIRERIDGRLVPTEPLPAGAGEELVGAFKSLAGMQTESRAAQDGRFFAQHAGRQIDVRASTYPTGLGESMTLRLLDPARVILDLDRLGFRPAVVEGLRELSAAPSGVFCVTGPSGQGKTTTLYCMLSALQRPELKLMTVEHPVELFIDGILQADLSQGGSFVDAMKAMLRNDLDIGMVGELRDAETIRLLFLMASTGHLMFSVLHAPDATSAVARLLEVGEVRPRLIVENLRGVLAQRLVPRSCPDCREMRPVSAAEARAHGLPARAEVAHNAGCEACHQTGIRGRTVVAELLRPTAALTAAIEGGGGEKALRAALPDGFVSLADDLREKVLAGEVPPAIQL